MEIPSYKSYQYLHDYALNMAQFLKQKNTKIKLYIELHYLRTLFCDEMNLERYKINYPIYVTNFDEYFKCFLYECSKYKFPKVIQKSIRLLHQYRLHHRKK